MYAKVFATMFDGSLHGHWEAIVTFTAMLVLSDQNGEVDITPKALAAKTSIPLDIIERGIADLERPDPESRTPDEGGRRIVRLDPHRSWGWRITNHKHYREIRTAEERREYFRLQKREQRAKSKSPPVSTESPHVSAESTNTEADTEAEAVASTPDAGATPLGKTLGLDEEGSWALGAILGKMSDLQQRAFLGELRTILGGLRFRPVPTPETLGAALNHFVLAEVIPTGLQVRTWIQNLQRTAEAPPPAVRRGPATVQATVSDLEARVARRNAEVGR